MTHRSLLTRSLLTSVFALVVGTACGPTSPTGTGGSGGSTGGSGGSTGGTGGGGTGGTGGFAGNIESADQISSMGPYPAQTYDLSVSYSNGPATMYYPGGSAPAPFGAIAATPGWQEGKDMWGDWGRFLASHGYVLLAYTPLNLNDLPTARAATLAQELQTLRSENGRAGSPLFGKIDVNRLGVMGHSMGGGGALAAANSTPSLKVAIALCPWSGGVTTTSDLVPSLIFAEVNDPLAGGQGLTLYGPPPNGGGIPDTTPKEYVEFVDQKSGQHFVANSPTLDPSKFPNSKSVARIGMAWLRVFMDGDARYKTYLAEDPVMDPPRTIYVDNGSGTLVPLPVGIGRILSSGF